MSEVNNDTEEVVRRGVISSRKTEQGYLLKSYNGQIVEMSLEQYNELSSNYKKVKNELTNQKTVNEKLKIDIQVLQEQNKTLTDKIDEYVLREKTRMENFVKNRGKNQNIVLTKEFKKMLQTMYETRKQNNMNLMDIHRAMVINGYKGTYESLRKYISQSKSNGKWL